LVKNRRLGSSLNPVPGKCLHRWEEDSAFCSCPLQWPVDR
jgi:hypothetical protein